MSMASITQNGVAEEEPALSESLLPLILLGLLVASGFMAMQSFGIMAESAKAELGLSDQALALIQGFGAAVPLVLFSIPIGILVDRMSRVRLLIGLALCWTAGSFLTALAPNAWVLFMARMMTAIGTTGALTATLSLTADLCRPEQRGRGMLISTLGKNLGVGAGFAVAGWLLGLFAAAGAPQWFGDIAAWRSAQWTLGLASIVLMLPLFLLREPPRHEVESSITAPFKVVMNEVWERRAFLIPLFVGQTAVVMADAAAGIWASPVLERHYGLKPANFGGWLGGLVLLGGFVGAIGGGLLADWGQKSGRRGGLLIGAVACAAIGIPASLFPLMPSVPAFGAAIFALLLMGTITGLITSVALTVLLPNELRGLTIGAFIAVAGLIGFGIAPSLVTLVSSLLGGEAMLREALAFVGVLVSIVSVFAFWVAMRRAPLSIHDHAE
jgi:MFS family permease